MGLVLGDELGLGDRDRDEIAVLQMELLGLARQGRGGDLAEGEREEASAAAGRQVDGGRRGEGEELGPEEPAAPGRGG
jgi:hypothetical protein